MLGRLLRATSFERWLCGEALDSLVAEASETLMELSGGQYQLDRDERNDLFVIDYQDAGASAPGAHAVGRRDLPGLAGPGPCPVPAGHRAVRRACAT